METFIARSMEKGFVLMVDGLGLPDEMKLPASSGGVSGRIPPKPTRLRSMSFGAVHLAIHPCGKPQGILAKANKLKERNLSLTDFPKMYNNSPTFSIYFRYGQSNVSGCGKDGLCYYSRL
jgi:hypothetical protein